MFLLLLFDECVARLELVCFFGNIIVYVECSVSVCDRPPMPYTYGNGRKGRGQRKPWKWKSQWEVQRLIMWSTGGSPIRSIGFDVVLVKDRLNHTKLGPLLKISIFGYLLETNENGFL